MATPKQIAANRRNSLKSTGPVTPAGKTASSMNALKTGLHAKSIVIPSEHAQDLQDLIDRYYTHHRPATPELCAILDDLIACEWELRRLIASEAKMWRFHIDDLWHKDTEKHPMGNVAANNSKSWSTLQRRLDSTRRARDRALKALRDLATNPIPVPEPPPAEAVNYAPKSTSPEIGFVPQLLPEPTSQPAPNPPYTPIGGGGEGLQSDIL